MHRRSFLAQAAASVVGGALLPAASRASADAAPPEQLRTAIAAARYPLEFDGKRFSGPGLDLMIERGRAAQAFLLGEEHGIAENPKLAATLFKALVPAGYRRLAIETSPTIAEAIDEQLRGGGLKALERFVTTPGSQAVFFGLREEAEWLAAARASVPGDAPLLWGLDYELTADRYLLSRLRLMPKPPAARRALAVLDASSAAWWAKYAATHDPGTIFSFAGDPALALALSEAWPSAGPKARVIIETLVETLTINRAWTSGGGYSSNLLRSRWLRSNFLRNWRVLERSEPDAHIFMKFGASHMIRGLSLADVFDLGSIVPDLVAERGDETFHLLVLPGKDSLTANFDPTRLRYVPGHRDEYGKGMEPFFAGAFADKFTLYETAPLRPLVRSDSTSFEPVLAKIIHGFDAVLIMTGSHPSTNLDELPSQ